MFNGSTSYFGNGSSDWPYVPIDSKQGKVLAGITAVGTLANALALLVTIRVVKKKLRPVDIFLISLILIDSYGIIFGTLPTHLCYIFRRWVGGDSMCGWQGFTSIFSSLSSGGIATALAFDRLIAIGKPFLYRKLSSIKKSLSVVAGVVVLTLVIALLPNFGAGGYVRNLTGTFCTIDWFAKSTGHRIFTLVFSIIGILMLIAVIGCNIAMIFLLVRSKQGSLLQQQNPQGKTSISRKERDLAILMMAISLLFIICWLPFMMRVITNIMEVKIDPWLDVNVTRLLLGNFIADPLVYVLARPQTRQIIIQWFYRTFDLLRKTRRKKLGSSTPSPGHSESALLVEIRRDTCSSSSTSSSKRPGDDLAHKVNQADIPPLFLHR